MATLRRVVSVLVAAAALAAAVPSPCAAAPAAPAPGQAAAASARPQLSREWRRLSSTHFTIAGSASPKDMAQLGVELETFLAVLQQMTPALKVASPVPTYVVALKDRDAYNAFQPRNAKGRREEWVAGYFTAGPDGNYMVMPWSGKDEASLKLLMHEFTHYLESRNLTTVPLWLAEGVSEFYSTFHIDTARNLAIVGEPPRDRVTGLVRRRLMPLDRLLAVGNAAELADRPEELYLFYAQSWALVHYLFLGEQGARTKQIGAYMQYLERGQSRDAAFATAFGGTYDEIGKALEKYVNEAQFPYLKLKPSTPGGLLADASRVQPMTEGDAAALQAVLLMRIGAVTEAEAALGRALAQPPSGLRERIALDRVRRQLGQKGDEAAQYEELAALAARDAAVRPLDASTHFYLSLAALAAGKEAESDAALEAAIRLNPDVSMTRQRAYAAFAFGNDAVAARDVRAFFQAPVWDSETAQYMAFLGALALRRLNEDDEASRLLAKAATAAASGTWAAKVLDYMQGKLAAAALLSAATNDGERTEAHTYVGFDDALAGRREAAITHFRWVKEKGSRNFVEYPIAVAELSRLEKPGSK